MKKNICTIFLLIGFVNFGIAQVKSVKLLDNRIANIHLIYEKSIDLEKGDTLYMVYMGFQNARYSSITDIKSIALFDIETLNEFLKDLFAAVGVPNSPASQLAHQHTPPSGLRPTAKSCSNTS